MAGIRCYLRLVKHNVSLLAIVTTLVEPRRNGAKLPMCPPESASLCASTWNSAKNFQSLNVHGGEKVVKYSRLVVVRSLSGGCGKVALVKIGLNF